MSKPFIKIPISPYSIEVQYTKKLLDTYAIISDQITRRRLEVVLGELEKVLEQGIEGDVVEFGCYIGTTSLFIRRLLSAYDSIKTFHAYDSFAGLPNKSPQDNSPVGADFKAGELSVSKKQFLEQFHKARLPAPVTHKGWFSDLTPADVPDKIAFAFLDGDFYDSIIDSLRLVWPRMAPGGVITIDDCGREALPGVNRAIRDFLQDKKYTVHVNHNVGVLRI